LSAGPFFQQHVHLDPERLGRMPERDDRRVPLAEFQPADIDPVNAAPGKPTFYLSVRKMLAHIIEPMLRAEGESEPLIHESLKMP
jgi:hypothetical protein